MSGNAGRPRKTGKTGPIAIGPNGVSRKFIDFPRAKEDVEAFIARLFIADHAGMRPQFARYGSFEGLEQQPEDALDFRVRTGLGFRWLELAEFAPLDQFAGDYENVSGSWPVGQVVSLVLGLIRKKANKGYGKDVILIIYKTHETFFVPPPILRTVRRQLLNNPPPFESVYYLSPHDPESASVWEIWPGDSNDDGPTLDTGSLHVGF